MFSAQCKPGLPGHFHRISPIGWFGLVLTMSVRLSVCVYICPLLMHFFKRPLNGPQISGKQNFGAIICIGREIWFLLCAFFLLYLTCCPRNNFVKIILPSYLSVPGAVLQRLLSLSEAWSSSKICHMGPCLNGQSFETVTLLCSWVY